MAGLLDIFGSSPDIYAGLLGEEGMAQAKRQAQSDALLNLSAALMKAGSPSRTPQGLGLGLVEGMQAAGRGYKESMQGALQEKLAQQKIAEAIASKQRAGAAQNLLTSALQPQLVSESTTGPSGVPYPVNQVRQATLQELIPQFAKYGTEGFDALSKYLDVQKAAKPQYVTLKEGEQLLDPTTLQPVAGQPKQNLTTDYKNWELAGKPGDFGSWLQQSKKPLVVMNEGQKGFENVSSLNKMFTAEPIYKELAGMDTAYKQVTSAIAAGTPIGDTAAATKIMKLLDPGSVVRETELGMAMAATGKLDLLSNYLSNYIKGTKLTDNQRKEFQSLANELYNAAASAYNTKRSQYKAIGDKFGLDTDVALGAPAKMMSSMPDGVVVKRRTQ